MARTPPAPKLSGGLNIVQKLILKTGWIVIVCGTTFLAILRIGGATDDFGFDIIIRVAVFFGILILLASGWFWRWLWSWGEGSGNSLKDDKNAVLSFVHNFKIRDRLSYQDHYMLRERVREIMHFCTALLVVIAGTYFAFWPWHSYLGDLAFSNQYYIKTIMLLAPWPVAFFVLLSSDRVGGWFDRPSEKLVGVHHEDLPRQEVTAENQPVPSGIDLIVGNTSPETNTYDPTVFGKSAKPAPTAMSNADHLEITLAAYNEETTEKGRSDLRKQIIELGGEVPDISIEAARRNKALTKHQLRYECTNDEKVREFARLAILELNGNLPEIDTESFANSDDDLMWLADYAPAELTSEERLEAYVIARVGDGLPELSALVEAENSAATIAAAVEKHEQQIRERVATASKFFEADDAEDPAATESESHHPADIALWDVVNDPASTADERKTALDMILERETERKSTDG